MEDFISNNDCHVTHYLQKIIHNLHNHIWKIIIPIESKDDMLVWKHTNSGTLALKDSQKYVSNTPSKKYQSYHIWNIAIPHFLSIMVRRLIRNKMPIIENLMKKRVSFFFNLQLLSQIHIINLPSFSLLSFLFQDLSMAVEYDQTQD